MNIVICVHNLSNGGAERVAALWANGFVESGDAVTLVLAEKNAPIEYDVSSKVIIENVYDNGNQFTRYVRKILKLRRLLKIIKPDVVIGVMPPWDIWLPMSTIGIKTKIIDTIHWSLERPASNPLNRSMKLHTFFYPRLFPVVTVLTEADRRIVKGKFRKCYAMPNPLAFKPCYYPEKKEKIIMASGRLEGWSVKGFDTLIKAWAKVSAKHPDWKLQVAGRGGEASVSLLNEMAKQNGVQGSFELLGFRSNIEKDYERASIFAFTSRCDGFGMVLIEAMSRGCACVSCDYKGRQSEIITSDKEGIVCQPEDVDAIANALDKLIRDDNLRKELQIGACRRADFFSVQNTTKRWYDIFCKEGIKESNK